MELLVVVAIIGVLVAITIPAINVARAKARDAKRTEDLRNFSFALEQYYENHQQYPVWEAGGGFQDSGGNNPLKVLVDEKIISSLPQDPLISKYVYYYITTDNGQTYKTVAYMEQDKQKAEKDGGTASTYYEAFAYPPEKQQAQLTDATLDEKMPVGGSSNIALNKPVTSLCAGCQLYGSCSSGCQGPENINDGDRSTSWYYCRCVQRAEIDLQGTYNICQVKGVWCGDDNYPNCSLKLEYFDGSNWQFLAQAAGNSCDSNNPVTINFSCVNAQKIRVNLPPSCEDYCQSEYTCGCPDYCGWVGINEIEVYP